MDGEILVVDECAEGEGLEEVDESFVYLRVVLLLALQLEIEEGGHCAPLVVAPKQVHLPGVADLEHQQECHDLDAELSAVHVVSQEQVLLLRHPPESLKDVAEIEKLAVDVADDGQRCVEFEKVRLRL